jgi:hypothetical protein
MLDRKGAEELLPKKLETAFKMLDCPFQMSKQDNHAVKSVAFNKNLTRTYCYILLEDRIRGRIENLVFRFRKSAKLNEWFRERAVDPLSRDWLRNFRTMWDKNSGVPARYIDPEIVTAQFGLYLSPEAIHDVNTVQALRTYLEIAVEAVNQSSRHDKNRDWSVYESLIR